MCSPAPSPLKNCLSLLPNNMKLLSLDFCRRYWRTMALAIFLFLLSAISNLGIIFAMVFLFRPDVRSGLAEVMRIILPLPNNVKLLLLDFCSRWWKALTISVIFSALTAASGNPGMFPAVVILFLLRRDARNGVAKVMRTLPISSSERDRMIWFMVVLAGTILAIPAVMYGTWIYSRNQTTISIPDVWFGLFLAVLRSFGLAAAFFLCFVLGSDVRPVQFAERLRKILVWVIFFVQLTYHVSPKLETWDVLNYILMSLTVILSFCWRHKIRSDIS